MTLAVPRLAARLLVVVSCCLVVAAMPAATPPDGPRSGPAPSDTLGVDAWRMFAASGATGFALVPRVDRLNPPSAVGYQPFVAVVAAVLAVTVVVALIRRSRRRARLTSSTRDPPAPRLTIAEPPPRRPSQGEQYQCLHQRHTSVSFEAEQRFFSH